MTAYIYGWGQKIGDSWFCRLERTPRLGLRAWLVTVFSKAREESCVAVEIATTEALMDEVSSICGAEYFSTIHDPFDEQHRRLIVMQKAINCQKPIAHIPDAKDPVYRITRQPLPQHGPSDWGV